MLILEDDFLSKIRPAISLDIHNNTIGSWQSPQKQRWRQPPAAATFVFFNYIVMNIRRDGRPNFCQKMILQNKHSKHSKAGKRPAASLRLAEA